MNRRLDPRVTLGVLPFLAALVLVLTIANCGG